MKVIKQEKTGLLLTFLLYFLFYEIGLCITMNKLSINFNFWFYAMVFSLFSYVLIKLSEKNNNSEPDSTDAKLFTMNSNSHNSNQ